MAVAVIAVAAGAAWWLVSRDAALEWLVAEAVRRSGGALAVDGVRGTLFGPITVRRLAYETSGLLVVLEDMTVDASPREMARGRLTVRSLEARTLRFESKPSPDPVRAPDSLALPLPVSIARAAIQEADLQGYKVRGLTFGYEGGADQQSVRALSAVSDDGHVEIDLRVGAHAPFELAGAVALRGKGALGDWTANAKLSGNLARAALVEASATAHGARAGGTARIAAFEPRWLEEFLVKLEDVDPAAFDARVPHAQLAIDISGAGTPDGLPGGPGAPRQSTPGHARSRARSARCAGCGLSRRRRGARSFAVERQPRRSRLHRRLGAHQRQRRQRRPDGEPHSTCAACMRRCARRG